MTPGPDRVLVIGLDGASAPLVEPWVRAGEPPELARLMEHGCHGELRSTFPPLTPPAWSSFMTGNPGKHGIFSFCRLAADGSAAGRSSPHATSARTLWEIVGEAGRPVGAINVPLSYPVRPVNGFMVSCPLKPPGDAEVISPPELRTLLGPGYEIAIDSPARPSPPSPTTASAPSPTSSGCACWRGSDATLRLLRERPWALLAVVFYEPDRIQDFF